MEWPRSLSRASHNTCTFTMCYKCRQNGEHSKHAHTVRHSEMETLKLLSYNGKPNVGLHQFILDIDQGQTHIFSRMDVRARARLLVCVFVFVFCSFCGVYFAGLLAQMDFIESFLFVWDGRGRPSIDVLQRCERCRFGV